MDLKKVAAPILKGSLKGQKVAGSILKGSQKAAAPILKEISKSGCTYPKGNLKKWPLAVLSLLE